MVYETIEYHFLIIASKWILETEQVLDDRLKFMRMLHTFDRQLSTTDWWTLVWIWAADGGPGPGQAVLTMLAWCASQERDTAIYYSLSSWELGDPRGASTVTFSSEDEVAVYGVLLPSSELSLCLLSARPRPHRAPSTPLPRPWPTPGTRREP